ncbi:MAG: condensation domain-containing protein [Actinomycetota bacterium]|nr:condensation domain-containing protein [Actinomycetota bacterium]
MSEPTGDSVGTAPAPGRPTPPAEEVLASMWQRVLGGGPVAGDTDLFVRGGTWFDAARVVSLVADAFDVDVEAADLAKAPTPVEMGRLIDDRRPHTGWKAAPKRSAPVAVSQEGMLWNELLTPGSFNMAPLVRRLRGPLDPGVLGAAFEALAWRHEPLRSTFGVRRGRAVQIVGHPSGQSLPVADLSDLGPADAEAEATRLIADAATRPFDVGGEPLFAPSLVRLGPDDHLVVVRLHHLVFDDWSVDVYRRDLSTSYAALADGTPSGLTEPAIAFSEVARHQRARLAGAAGTAEMAWWRETLAGAPLTTQLPVGAPDRVRPRGPSRPVSLTVPRELSGRIRALARHGRATPFITLLAAFEVLLHRWSGEDDLLIATVVANRDERSAQDLVGCFTKKVPLRLRLEGDPTFLELVSHVRQRLFGALAHHHLGYETVLQETVGRRAADHGLVPHVPIMFQGLVPARGELRLRGLAGSSFGSTDTQGPGLHVVGPERDGSEAGNPDRGAAPRRDWGGGLYPGTFLGVSVLDDGDDLTCVVQGGFHPPAVRALLDEYLALLVDIVAAPLRKAAELVRRDTGAAHTGAAHTTVPGTERFAGFTFDRGLLETALTACAGVAGASVAVEDGDDGPRIVAEVTPEPGPPLSLTRLRKGLWHQLPGSPWPATLVVRGSSPEPTAPADGLRGRPPGDPPGGEEARLATAWARVLRVPEVRAQANYWQRFSFFEALDDARRAGAEVTAEQVARNRTIETLAADIASGQPAAGGAGSASDAGTITRGGGSGPTWRKWRRMSREGPAVVVPPVRQASTAAATAVEATAVEATAVEATAGVPGTEVIRTEGLTKTYPSGLAAVNGLDLSVYAGEIFGLLGPNGAGKTTTIGMLTTLVMPTAGRACVAGVDVVADPALAKQFMGVVPQANNLDNNLTVFENLYFHGRYFGMGAGPARRAAEELLERLRLAGRGRDRVEHLSGGMVRRLLLGRALMQGPAIIFLDEPTAGLDPQSRLALWDILDALHQGGQTILLTTHDMDVADRFCDRVAIMDHGRILALDTPKVLKRSLGSGTSVIVRGEGDLDDLVRRLDALEWTRDCRRTDVGVRVVLDRAEGALPSVMALAEEARVKISDVAVSEDSLEAVFINLTGRELRE